ncbi:MAG TPA: hypothetical protein VF813_12615 [Anaerolineaceae bacterium]
MLRTLAVILAVLLGICAGLALGWLALPVPAGGTGLDALRVDYKADYVLMVAESYHARPDLGRAASDLALLGEGSPATAANQAVVWANRAGYAPDDLRRMAELAAALRGSQP